MSLYESLCLWVLRPCPCRSLRTACAWRFAAGQCSGKRVSASGRQACEPVAFACLRSTRGTGLALTVGGCSAAPSQNILGSFFPAWVLCGAIGVATAVGCRILLVALKLDQHVVLPALTYLGVAVAVASLIWLVRFGN